MRHARKIVLPVLIVAVSALIVGIGAGIVAGPGFRSSVRAADDVRGQWAGIGPSPVVRNAFDDPKLAQVPFSGRIGSIAVDPTNLNHWLLGVGNGGVWETRDAGGSWLPLTDAAPTLSTGDIAFDPGNPQIVYVGTGEAHGSGMAKGGVGILKSTDGLRTWTVVGATSFARGSVKRLRVNPAKSSELAAASTRGGFGRTSQDFPQSPPPYGILKSSDAGQTWTRTLAGQATALEIDPANFNRQYAAIGENKTGQDAGVSANGVYRSKDAGEHWDVISGPWPVSSPSSLAAGRIELALAPSNPNVIYASISQVDGNRILGLYRTDNAWDDAPAWRQISTAQASYDISGPSGSFCTLCNYSHVISVSPSDPNMLFAGGKVLLSRCSNCGASPQWTHVPQTNGNAPDTFADQQAIAWAGNRLILGNDGGVFSTTDFGGSWQNHNPSISTVMFYNGALHPTNPNFIISGARDHNLPIRRDSSFVWAAPPRQQSGEFGAEGEVAMSSKHPETDWMGSTVGAEIYRTTDGARTAIRADAGFDRTDGYGYPIPVRKCPSNDDVFLAGTTKLYRTENFFNSISPSWSFNGPSGAASTTGSISSIAFAPTDVNCGTYAYGSSGIRLTRDAGKTWVDLDPGKVLPLRLINSIAFDPSNRDTLYVALSAFNTTAQGTVSRHVYKTTNASAASPTWTNISPPEDVPFDVIAIDPRNSSLVYAGSDTGLWVSGDAGASWQKVGPDRGLPHAAIYDVQINPATNVTVVFTHGRGAFQLAK